MAREAHPAPTTRLATESIQGCKGLHPSSLNDEGPFSLYDIVGITNSAPARMPVGQRLVTVFSRV